MSKTILFQGDSITDAGRINSENGLGNGYVAMIAKDLASQEELCILNRGISGNRAIDLVERWQADCIQLAPDVLTILIGINDCWKKYKTGEDTPVALFEERYVSLLESAQKNTRAQIILMEPFLLHSLPDQPSWRETLDPEIQVVRKLAVSYKTRLITLDAMFAELSTRYGYAALAEDGVHPTPLGHQAIAQAWQQVFSSL